MAQDCIYIAEENSPIVTPFNQNNAYNIGDLCALISGKVVAAVDFTYSGGPTSFGNAFLGHCFQYKASGGTQVYGNCSSGVLCVSTTGVYQAPLDAATTVQVGDWVSISFLSGGSLTSGTLQSQKVKVVSGGPAAIGRIVEQGTSATSVKFRLLSTVMPAAK